MNNTKPSCKHGEKDRDWNNLMIPEGHGVKIDDMRMLAPKNLPAPLPPVVLTKDIFQLKKLKIHPDMSEETTCFSAEVWFRKKLVGYASNGGHGGGTMARPKERGSLEEAEKWALELPPESAYNRVYEAMLNVEAEFTTDTVDNIKKAWWFSASRMDLTSVVDSIVERAAGRKSIRGIGSYAAFGPGPETDGKPGIMKFKRTIQPAWLVGARKNHKWAVPLTAFFDTDPHYYPSPHPIASSAGRDLPIRHKESGVTGIPYYRGTHDHAVVLQAGEGDDEKRIDGKPEDFEFLAKAKKVTKKAVRHE